MTPVQMSQQKDLKHLMKPLDYIQICNCHHGLASLAWQHLQVAAMAPDTFRHDVIMGDGYKNQVIPSPLPSLQLCLQNG